jgi:hypothetical protein
LMEAPIPHLLSSVEGAITAILLVYPGASSAAGEAEYAEIVQIFDAKGIVYRFMRQLPAMSIKLSRLRGGPPEDAPRFRALHTVSPVTQIAEVIAHWRDELQAAAQHDQLRYRRWAQDPFLVLTCPPWTILLDSLHQRRLADFFLPLELAEQAGAQFLVRPTRLHIEGGNVLQGATRTFVGMDMVHQNSTLLRWSEAAVMHALQECLGAAVVQAVGYPRPEPALKADGGETRLTAQPIFHIDMFMTCGGLITDEIELIFVADSTMAEEILRTSDKAQFPDIEYAAACKFDRVAKQLADAGLVVHRIPIFLFGQTIYSWNNALVEVTARGKNVYLPTYQCPHDPEQLNPTFASLEQAVATEYAMHGFTVHWIGSGRLWRILAHQGGSLNCVVKVLARNKD